MENARMWEEASPEGAVPLLSQAVPCRDRQEQKAGGPGPGPGSIPRFMKATQSHTPAQVCQTMVLGRWQDGVCYLRESQPTEPFQVILMGKLRLGEGKQPAQDHRASWWQSQKGRWWPLHLL
jgi:hypothetical protein